MILSTAKRPQGVTILSQRHVDRALSDASFVARLPEFAALRTRYMAGEQEQRQRGGCSGCGKRRYAVSFFNEFTSTLRRLSEERKATVRQYFGVSKLTTNTYNPATGSVSIVEL